MIEAKIIADSLSPANVRLATFVLTYPRFIHSEVMTHRTFSRNASSSRAIPVKKQIQMVIDNPAIPLAFTKNQKGMQGGEVLEGKAHELAIRSWLHARDNAVSWAKTLADLEVHKQYSNRILEPFAHITVVCTATDYDNFFALRCHADAQPEIHALADKMYELYQSTQPKKLKAGEWHLPFMDDDTKYSLLMDDLVTKKIDNFSTEVFEDIDENAIKCSVARCARVSYLNHEGKNPTLQEDLNLYDRLLGGTPIHASPAEHQAMAVSDPNVRSGNFRGWIQYRKTLQNENIAKFTLNEPK